jgi:ABC-type phosphate transport system ATPase subunit
MMRNFAIFALRQVKLQDEVKEEVMNGAFSMNGGEEAHI